jgi:peptidoglycan/LPS O-acetylase OafA/YrhL
LDRGDNVNKRYEELDSLRGLAAVSVVLFHFFIALYRCFPSFQFITKLENTPLQIFWAGNEAVILFFVLSGFVLSLPYYNDRALKYKYYVVRRICRIYIPYLVSVVLAILFMGILYREGVPAIGGWFDISINHLPTKLLIGHITLLGEFDSDKLNIVFWSLAHEMRISILFPLVMFFVLKYSWKKNIIVALSMSISFFLIYYLNIKLFSYDITKNSTSYFSSIRYIAFFITGALLARHMESFRLFYEKIPSTVKILLGVIGILSYTYPRWFFYKKHFLHMSFINDVTVVIGCSIFIIFSINSKKISSILMFKPIHFVGKISYSLYLFHMIVLLAMFNGLYGRVPTIAIWLASLAISFIMAAIMYYVIERPSIKLGKFLTTKKPPKTKVNRDEVKITEKQFI